MRDIHWRCERHNRSGFSTGCPECKNEIAEMKPELKEKLSHHKEQAIIAKELLKAFPQLNSAKETVNDFANYILELVQLFETEIERMMREQREETIAKIREAQPLPIDIKKLSAYATLTEAIEFGMGKQRNYERRVYNRLIEELNTEESKGER